MRKSIDNYSEVLLPEEVMDILQIGKSTLYSYLSSGTIKSIKIANKYRVPKQYLLDFIYQNKDVPESKGNHPNKRK